MHAANKDIVWPAQCSCLLAIVCLTVRLTVFVCPSQTNISQPKWQADIVKARFCSKLAV